MTEIRFRMQEGELSFRVGQLGVSIYESTRFPDGCTKERLLGWMHLCDMRVAVQSLYAAAKELDQMELEHNASMRRE